MTKVQPITNESVKSESEVLREQHLAQTPIDHILQKLSCMELPAKTVVKMRVAKACKEAIVPPKK